jgi:dynein light chain LC8-type
MSDADENEVKEAPLPPYNLRTCQVPAEHLKIILRSAAVACEKYTLQKDIAEHIKKEIDQKSELNTVPGKGPWQCIIGKSFASAVTFERSHVAYFDLPSFGQTVLVYKSLGVQSN